MKILEIKGTVPGAGKTYTIVSAFVKSNLPNKVLLAPTNKVVQIHRKLLVDVYGITDPKTLNKVITIRKFKKNYLQVSHSVRYFDQEAFEWEERVTSTDYYSIESKSHYKKIWNIFLDEASMVSKKEIDDLVNHWKINNLVLAGDSNQFEPIANVVRIEEEGEQERIWYDAGENYNLKIDHQILLNNSMRARDPKLVNTLNEIKKGNLYEIANIIERNEFCEFKSSDWHIAYTNYKCSKINKMYTKVSRFIVKQSDKKHGFAKSEILEADDYRLKALQDQLNIESVTGDSIDFETWKQIYLAPAMAVTCHKLQGSTISEGKIYIHLDDLIKSVLSEERMSFEDQVKLFQKYLYIAISRAVSADQIQILGASGISKKGKNFTINFVDTLLSGDEEFVEKVSKLFESAPEMIDESIWETPDFEGSSKDSKALETILDCLNYDESEVSKLQGEDEYLAKISKAHSKKRNHKYTDDYLLSKSWEEIVKETRNAKIRKRWKLLHSIVPTTNKVVGFEINSQNIENQTESLSFFTRLDQ